MPFTWYATRRRPELYGGEMIFEMDDTGMRFRTSMYDSRVAWAYVRKARDLGRFLFFDSGTGVNMSCPSAPSTRRPWSPCVGPWPNGACCAADSRIPSSRGAADLIRGRSSNQAPFSARLS